MGSNNLKKTLVTSIITALITAVICAILFSIMTKTSMELKAIAFDLPFTVIFTALISGLIQVITARGAAKKGTALDVGSLEGQAAYVLVPKNAIVFLLIFTILATLIFSAAPIGLLYLFAPGCIMPRFGYVAFKSILAGVSGGYISFHANVFVAALYQKEAA